MSRTLDRVDEPHTTLVIQGYLDDLAALGGDAPADPVVRQLLSRAADRLHVLCASLLYRTYPRLARPPLNLGADEMLSAVVERLLKALREARPSTVRQFFAIANQHMRWELNDLARRLDKDGPAPLMPETLIAPAESSGGPLSPVARRLFDAIDALPEAEREAFSLVRIQGLNRSEAAEVVGVSAKTMQRRVNRALLILSEQLGDLRPEREEIARRA